MPDFVPNTAINNSKSPVLPMAKSFPLVFTSTMLSVELATGGQSTGNTLSPQSAVVDNSLGGSTFTLTVDGTAYQVDQGATQTFTLLSSEFPRIYASATAPGTVRVMLTNALLPPSTSGGAVNTSQADLDKLAATVGTVPQPTAMTTFSQPIIAGGAVTGANPLPVTGGTGSLTDGSGTITTASTSQQIFAANSARKYLFIQNSSVNNMWINFTSAAILGQPSILISPGSVFTMENNFISNEAINIIGATANATFTAKEA